MSQTVKCFKRLIRGLDCRLHEISLEKFREALKPPPEDDETASYPSAPDHLKLPACADPRWLAEISQLITPEDGSFIIYEFQRGEELFQMWVDVSD
jgi:hypothetical protein